MAIFPLPYWIYISTEFLIDNLLGSLLIYSGKAAASSSNELFGSFFSILKFAAYVTTFILTIAGMIIMAG